jgi:hypothetical protein
LLFLEGWGYGDMSMRPKLMPYDRPLDPSVSFDTCWPAWVLWRDKDTGLSHSKLLRSGALAEIEAAWLRWLGHHDVRVKRLGGCDDDGLAGVTARL